ncbi:hypothetical protein ANN_13840 [Periplaneta americana]|uniref:Uncharacterized protein n=1 Tax=Periplaneta americana TaxID=6978 RepID=A0ABQ8SVV8_PERAM|nr:hypothetical protein ANN_13840 [Periplaneta americana]
MAVLCEDGNEPPGSLKAVCELQWMRYAPVIKVELFYRDWELISSHPWTAMFVLFFEPDVSSTVQNHSSYSWTDSSAVAAVKSLPSEQLLEDILFIDSDIKIVPKSITLLESSKLQLSEALNIVDKVSQTVIQNKNSLISEKVKCHDKTSEVGVLKSSDFPYLKYAPITSCDVECTFS